jgi:hypothetical protein
MINSNKKDFLFWAVIMAIVCVTMISIIPTTAKIKERQLAQAKVATTQREASFNNLDISGKRIIGVSIKEDFGEKESHDHRLHDHHISKKFLLMVKNIH